MSTKSTELSFEKKRKIFHLSSLVLILLYLFISKFSILIALFLMLSVTLFLDTSRHYNPKIKLLIDKFFVRIIRKNEESGTFKLSGTTYMISGFFLSALLFSKELAITSWLILIISDPFSAIVGIKAGGTYKVHEKTLEGACAFLVSSIFISMLSYYFLRLDTSLLVIIISCIVTALIELYSKKINIDDNLLIPLGYGFTTVLFNFLLNL